MAKRLSAQRALQAILEEKEASDDVEECEDHISENSESNSNLEEEDEVDHQFGLKRR